MIRFLSHNFQRKNQLFILLQKGGIMLKEIKYVRQSQPGYRRIFEDERYELYVFYPHKGARMSGFQLIDNKASGSCAFTWENQTGFHHYKLDDGEEELFKPVPILIPVEEFDVADIAIAFDAAARKIDSEVFDNVTAKLREYSDTRKKVTVPAARMPDSSDRMYLNEYTTKA
jgi:hypothetical protein